MRRRSWQALRGDDLDDPVADLQPLRLRFPEADRGAAAMQANAKAGGEGGQRPAHLRRCDVAFVQRDAAAVRGEIGDVIGQMLAMRRAGEQQTGKAAGLMTVRRAGLPG